MINSIPSAGTEVQQSTTADVTTSAQLAQNPMLAAALSCKQFGSKPQIIDTFKIDVNEYMFYMYMPVKLPNTGLILEPRLKPFEILINAVIADTEKIDDKYIYLTVKHQFHPKGLSHNRPNWHSDGFGTDDVNYILYSNTPTEICVQDYLNIPNDDVLSIVEFEKQSKEENIITLPNFSLIKLTSEHIHRIGVKKEDGVRLFVKISVSKNTYKLKGNSHNYSMNYDWDLSNRKLERNVP